nr:hypothetical protein CFP56_54521 [Quercus suber]
MTMGRVNKISAQGRWCLETVAVYGLSPRKVNTVREASRSIDLTSLFVIPESQQSFILPSISRRKTIGLPPINIATGMVRPISCIEQFEFRLPQEAFLLALAENTTLGRPVPYRYHHDSTVTSILCPKQSKVSPRSSQGAWIPRLSNCRLVARSVGFPLVSSALARS